MQSGTLQQVPRDRRRPGPQEPCSAMLTWSEGVPMRAMRQHARPHDDDLVSTPIQVLSEVVRGQ
jgi:hypothetical protein